MAWSIRATTLIIQVELAPRFDPWDRLADDVGNPVDPLRSHPGFKAVGQVVDDPEPVVHHRGADLDRGLAPRRKNSAASCQVPTPPIPLIGTAMLGSPARLATICSAIGLTAGPQ